jgi:vacuolar-type H+-ATPase subunit H
LLRISEVRYTAVGLDELYTGDGEFARVAVWGCVDGTSATMKTEARFEAEGAAGALEGYGAGIVEILEREQQRLKKNADDEAARILAEAKQVAQSISAQAEAKADQEAIERTKYDVERVLAGSKGEAARVLAEGWQDAQTQAAKILADARQQAETLARTLTEEAKAGAEALSKSAIDLKSRVEQEVAATREKALLEAAQVVKDAVDAAKARVADRQDRIVTEAAHDGDAIAREAADRARKTLEEAVAAVSVAVQAIGTHLGEMKDEDRERSRRQVYHEFDAARSGPAPEFEHGDKPAEQAGTVEGKPLSVAQVLDTDMLFDRGDNSVLYCGDVELNIVPPADVHQLSEFQDHLKTVPNLEIHRFDRTASADLKISIVAAVAMPLFDIVRSLPSVEEAEQIGKDILITLLPAHRGKKRRVTARSQDQGNGTGK